MEETGAKEKTDRRAEQGACVVIDRSTAVLRERYALSAERFQALGSLSAYAEDCGCTKQVAEALLPFDAWFSAVADAVCHCDRADKAFQTGACGGVAGEQPFASWETESTVSAWLNAAYAEQKLGCYGPLLSAWYAELESLILCLYEGRTEDAAALLETSLQLYAAFEEAAETCGQAARSGFLRKVLPEESALRDIVYSYYYDYLDAWTAADVAELCQGGSARWLRLIKAKGASLEALGLPITAEARQTADWLAAQPEAALRRMADAVVTAYLQQVDETKQNTGGSTATELRAGAKGGAASSAQAKAAVDGTTEVAKAPKVPKAPKALKALKALKASSTRLLPLSVPLGFERLLYLLADCFAKQGIALCLPRGPLHLPGQLCWPFAVGIRSASMEQRQEAHLADAALFQGDRLKARRLEALRHALHREAAGLSRLSAPLWVGTEAAASTVFEEQASGEGLGKTERSAAECAALQRASRFSAHQKRVNASLQAQSAALFEKVLPPSAQSKISMVWPRPEAAEGIEAYAERFCRCLRQSVRESGLFEMRCQEAIDEA